MPPLYNCSEYSNCCNQFQTLNDAWNKWCISKIIDISFRMWLYHIHLCDATFLRTKTGDKFRKSNIPLERIAYWPKSTVEYWSVSNFFKWNILSSAKYHKINYTRIGGNNMAKFIHHQILANTLILKVKRNENISDFFPIDILLINICLAPVSVYQFEFDLWQGERHAQREAGKEVQVTCSLTAGEQCQSCSKARWTIPIFPCRYMGAKGCNVNVILCTSTFYRTVYCFGSGSRN